MRGRFLWYACSCSAFEEFVWYVPFGGPGVEIYAAVNIVSSVRPRYVSLH